MTVRMNLLFFFEEENDGEGHVVLNVVRTNEGEGKDPLSLLSEYVKV